MQNMQNYKQNFKSMPTYAKSCKTNVNSRTRTENYDKVSKREHASE